MYESCEEPSISSRCEEEKILIEKENFEAQPLSTSTQKKNKEHIMCLGCDEKIYYKNWCPLTKKKVDKNVILKFDKLCNISINPICRKKEVNKKNYIIYFTCGSERPHHKKCSKKGR